jgi:chitinase
MPRKLLALVILAICAAGCASAGRTGGSPSKASATTTGTPPWYAPYVDATLSMPQFPTGHVVLGFVIGKRCTPSWGGRYTLDQATTINARIAQAQSTGDEVIVGFGGVTGPELANSCTDPTALERAYQTVIRRYALKTIDLDIEAASLNSAANARRAQAIAALQRARAAAGKPLAVWLTLAVDPHGIPASGISAIKQMLAAGVTVSGVNVMTFDYAPLAAGQTVLSASESAINNTATQVEPLGISPAELGATIMAGNTDRPGQTWSLSSAQAFYTFAYAHHLGRLSEWSLNRDQQCVGTQPQPSDACSGVTQQRQQFSTVLGRNAGQS